MFIELHVLQNFAPSNLNRDDTNSPKDCTFGGFRRARISSQCIKRSVRSYFRSQSLLDEKNMASRTKRLLSVLTARLVEQGRPQDQAKGVVNAALQAISAKTDDRELTQYLWFVGESELDAVVKVCLANWDALIAVAGVPRSGEEASAASGRAAKKAARAAVPDGVRKALEGCLDGGKAVDLALFGRMIADLPDKNIDAASQVAHAISTHKVTQEFDFYTAVDDLKSDDATGADMMGTVEFNSACFYRYMNIDMSQLKTNLKGDIELAVQGAQTAVKAAVLAIPTGKQNSTAAHNLPSFVLAVVRHGGLWSLANAFARPVVPVGGDLIGASVTAIGDYWDKMVRAYGKDDIVYAGCLQICPEQASLIGVDSVSSLDELITEVTARVAGV